MASIILNPIANQVRHTLFIDWIVQEWKWFPILPEYRNKLNQETKRVNVLMDFQLCKLDLHPFRNIFERKVKNVKHCVINNQT